MRRLLPWSCSLVFALALAAQEPEAGEECTVGVACGRATADGRPLLWKNRDAHKRDNVVMAFTDGRTPYLGLGDAGNRDVVWGGANAAGFCIVNSVARDLPGGASKGPGNGAFMKLALRQCDTVEQFAQLLRQTDETGRRTRANFGVIDATGAAAFFEVGHTSHRRFDAAASETGILVRTNFATTGGGERGRERFARADLLCRTPQAKALTPRFLLQTLLRDLEPPPSALAGEAGHQDVRETIHRQTTVAALVLQGVQAGEDAAWTTMWTVLGQPLFASAVPLWPAAGELPAEVAGAPRSALGDASWRLADAFYVPPRGGAAQDGEEPAEAELAGPVRWLRTDALPPVRRAVLDGEDEVLARHAEAVAAWRAAGPSPRPEALRAFQQSSARLVLQRLEQAAVAPLPVPAGK